VAILIDITRPYFIRSRCSGKFIDVPRGSTANGTGIAQYSYNGGPNQRWYLIPVPAIDLNKYVSVPVTVTAFTFEIVPYFNTRMALDVPNGSRDYGTQIIQWSIHGANNQRWRLAPINDSYFKIVSVNSGLVLDIPGGTSNDGAPVIQWGDNGGTNQHWSLSAAPGDSIVGGGGGGGGGAAPAGVLESMLGYWRSSSYSPVTVRKDNTGYWVGWGRGGKASLTLEGNTLWVREIPASRNYVVVANVAEVSSGRIVWNKASGGYDDTWTKV